MPFKSKEQQAAVMSLYRRWAKKYAVGVTDLRGIRDIRTVQDVGAVAKKITGRGEEPGIRAFYLRSPAGRFIYLGKGKEGYYYSGDSPELMNGLVQLGFKNRPMREEGIPIARHEIGHHVRFSLSPKERTQVSKYLLRGKAKHLGNARRDPTEEFADAYSVYRKGRATKFRKMRDDIHPGYRSALAYALSSLRKKRKKT